MARTASSDAHRKVLDAAAELMAERGMDATSMDAVAAHSGVSKATIYKHWADKEALMLETMADLHGLHTRPPFNSGNTRQDILDVLCYKPEHRTELRERMLPHLMAYSSRNPEFGHAWRGMVMEPPRQELRRLLSQGMAKRELVPELDIELSLSLLLGPMMYWFIFMKRFQADPKDLATGVVEAFWRAYGNPGRVRSQASVSKATKNIRKVPSKISRSL